MKKFMPIVIFTILLLALFVPLPLHAQTSPPEAHVIHTVAKDNKDSLGLSVLFTIFDSNNQPILKDAVKDYREGTIQLTTSQSSPVTATIQPATTPIKIALVIDASGSMGPVMANVKQAAITFVQNTPANAEIAVFSFADDFTTKQTFTGKDKLQLVENAIQDIRNKPSGTGDTCLYNAAFQSIKALTDASNTSPEERHAVVLFTDGRDREGGGKACGDMQAQNVIAQANLADRIPIQIHTIGLCEQADCKNVDQGALDNLAKSTYALSKIGAVGDLDSLFQTILQGLDSQWYARGNVLAMQGKNRATLNFSATVQNAAQDFSIPTDEFYSPKDYTTHAAVKIAERGYDPIHDIYTLSLTVSDPAAVRNITTQFFDNEKKSTVITSTQTITNITATMQITQTAIGLQPGREYCSQVRAEAKDGTALTNDKADPVLASECGKYDPQQTAPVSFQVTAGLLNWPQHTFDITLDAISPANASLVYEGYVNDNDDTNPVTDIGRAFLQRDPLFPQKALIRVTVPETETLALQKSQAEKEYTLHLKLWKDGDAQSTEHVFKLKAIAPRPPTFLQRVLASLGNPPVLIGIFAIILIGIAIGVYPKLRAKSTAIPRPALPQNEPTVVYPPKSTSKASGDVTAISSDKTVLATPPKPKMRLRIKVIRTLNPAEQREEDIIDFPCMIGREGGKEPGKKYFVIIGDKEISRAHAEITVQDDKFFITDLKSTNGTFIDDTRLEKEKPTSLAGKTAIRLGTFTTLEVEPRAG